MKKNIKLNYEYPIFSNYYDKEINKYCSDHDIAILLHPKDDRIVRYIAPLRKLKGLHELFFSEYTFMVLEPLKINKKENT